MQRLELRDHREYSAGVWLPKRIENIQYDYLAATPKGRQRLVVHSAFVLLRASVNSLDDSLFNFEPPPGALKVNEVTRESVQVRTGGTGLLEQLAEELKCNFPSLGRQSMGREPPLLLIIALVLAGVEFGRRLRELCLRRK